MSTLQLLLISSHLSCIWVQVPQVSCARNPSTILLLGPMVAAGHVLNGTPKSMSCFLAVAVVTNNCDKWTGFRGDGR